MIRIYQVYEYEYYVVLILSSTAVNSNRKKNGKISYGTWCQVLYHGSFVLRKDTYPPDHAVCHVDVLVRMIHDIIPDKYQRVLRKASWSGEIIESSRRTRMLLPQCMRTWHFDISIPSSGKGRCRTCGRRARAALDCCSSCVHLSSAPMPIMMLFNNSFVSDIIVDICQRGAPLHGA